MDSLEIDGKEYISSRTAARRHSYTTDYVGQLIRKGAIAGKKVGRTWYVDAASLDAYVGVAGTPSSPSDAVRALSVEKLTSPSAKHEVREAPKPAATASSYELLRYAPETDEPIPSLSSARREPIAHISLNSIIGEAPIEDTYPEVAEETPSKAEASDWNWSDGEAEEPVRPAALPRKSPVQAASRNMRTLGSFGRGAAFAASIALAVISLLIGALSLVGVKEIDFNTSSYSATITSIEKL